MTTNFPPSATSPAASGAPTGAAQSARTAAPVMPNGASLRGAGLREVRLATGFWGDLQQLNAAEIIPHCLTWMSRLGWIDNFDRVADGEITGPRPGWQFSDSEVYKLLEAIAWALGTEPSAQLTGIYDSLVSRIAAAQDSDGYLNTKFGHAGQAARYSDLEEGHELYCAGHLIQAAVARKRTHGEDDLVQIARRVADHVCETFGPEGNQGICGHAEIEVALAEFGRAVSQPRYVEQAKRFIDRRGYGSLTPIPLLGPAYFQDEVPVRATESWHGHAVRALYLAAGAIDVATETNDRDLHDAIERQWAATVERRTYLTGGMGSRHQDEGFGDDWELPPDRAYCETCAGIASVMTSWRLLLSTGDVKYADLIERTFFNVIATSPRSDGKAFFYANPLQQRVPSVDVRDDTENSRAEGGVRAPWFEVSCCPTNVARVLSSWHAYVVAVDGNRVSLAQYARGQYDLELVDGEVLGFHIDTDYPDDGLIRLIVNALPRHHCALRLRVPAWAHGAVLRRQGRADASVEPGWVEITPALVNGETIELQLPDAARFTWPDTRIDAQRGTVAVERGPLVLALESVDLPNGSALENVRINASAALKNFEDGALAEGAILDSPAPSSGMLPYGARQRFKTASRLQLKLVPYYRWAERGPSTMRVSIPTI